MLDRPIIVPQKPVKIFTLNHGCLKRWILITGCASIQWNTLHFSLLPCAFDFFTALVNIGPAKFLPYDMHIIRRTLCRCATLIQKTILLGNHALSRRAAGDMLGDPKISAKLFDCSLFYISYGSTQWYSVENIIIFRYSFCKRNAINNQFKRFLFSYQNKHLQNEKEYNK